MGDEINRDYSPALRRAGLIVTALRFSADDVTTAARLSQSTKGLRGSPDLFLGLLSNEAKIVELKTDRLSSL